MVRGVGRTSSGRAVFCDVLQNGDPPQSTLAAQLVHNLTDGKKHSKNQDQETFRQLLREVLTADTEHGPQSQMHDVDCDIDYKLIYVVVKAGLDTLISEDPFGDKAEQSTQAIDSLAAVQTTLRKNPQVLFVDAPLQIPGEDRHGPLFVWLIPQVLVIAGHNHEEKIRNSVSQVLEMMLLLEKKQHDKSVKRNPILTYTKSCIKGFSELRYMMLAITNDS